MTKRKVKIPVVVYQRYFEMIEYGVLFACDSLIYFHNQIVDDEEVTEKGLLKMAKCAEVIFTEFNKFKKFMDDYTESAK